MNQHQRCAKTLVAFAFGICLLGSSIASAQLSTTGTITGTVSDSTGAAIPGAAVSILNESTGETRMATTNSDGTFSVVGLPAAHYSVTVTKVGFQTYKEKSIVLLPTAVVNIVPVLKIGDVSTTVEVSAVADVVDTSTAEITGQVSGYQAETLPMNGRNFATLGSLMPGVTNVFSGSALGGGSDQNSQPLSISGSGLGGTLFTIDGVWNIDAGAMSNISITPPPESIQELQILENNFSVQYNLMGANVVMIETKSGGSTFHGSAFEFLRNDALDARNFFAPTVPALKQNIFGYTVGGPVFIPRVYNRDRNKTFFFLSQQWRLQHIASVLQGATPTADMRNGLFSTPITDPTTGALFPQNAAGQYVIPTSRINPNSAALMNALMPLPNNPAGGFLNYQNLNPQINRQRDDQIRIDHNINSKLRLMGEFFDEHQDLNFPNEQWLNTPFSTTKFIDGTDSYLAQIQLTASISSNMVNSLSIATSQYVDNLNLQGTYLRSQVPGFNEILPYNGFLSNRLPQVDFTGGYPSIGVNEGLPLIHCSDLEDTLTDDWSWLHGQHSVQAGGTVMFGTKRQNNYAQSNGDWLFTGQFSGDPIADFLLGDAATLNQASGETRPYSHYPLVSPYVQDRWKARRNLTLTIGLRLLYEPVPHAQRGYVSIFDPADYNPADAPIVNTDGTVTPTPSYNPLNGMITNGVNGVPLNFTTMHEWYWSPNFGFAWDIFGDGKTALRGGYAVNYTRVPTSGDCSYTCSNNPPHVETITLINPSFPDALSGQVAPLSAPTLQGQQLNTQSSQIQNYSLSIQHQFPGNWFFSVAGAGDIGRHLFGSININQPLPDGIYNYNPIINSGTVFPYAYSPYQGYAAINTYVSDMRSSWNALEVTLRHSLGHNLFVSAAYTWQHALTNERGNFLFGGASTTQNIYNTMADYGTANFNSTQTFSASVIYTFPWFRDAKGFAGHVLGGWQFTDITTIYSGFALDPTLSVPFQGLATRPNRISNDVQGPKTVAEWFNTAAFSQPAPGYFGNAGTGIITGPGLVDFDMSLSKFFPITEHQRIEFRAELFNIFNHPNFNQVQTAFGAANFGMVTGAADPRIAEAALRFEF